MIQYYFELVDIKYIYVNSIFNLIIESILSKKYCKKKYIYFMVVNKICIVDKMQIVYIVIQYFNRILLII